VIVRIKKFPASEKRNCLEQKILAVVLDYPNRVMDFLKELCAA